METIKALLADDPVRAIPFLELSHQSHSLLFLGPLQALLLRESMGITAESTTRAFKQPSVDELMMRVKPDPVPVKHIFVAIDPSGGGESAFGIATIACLSNGDTMVRRPLFQCTPVPHPSCASLRRCVIARLIL